MTSELSFHIKRFFLQIPLKQGLHDISNDDITSYNEKIFIMLFMKVNVVAWKSQVCKIFMTKSDIRPDNWRQLQVDKKI